MRDLFKEVDSLLEDKKPEVVLEESLHPMSGDNSWDDSGQKVSISASLRRSLSNGLDKMGNYHDTLSAIITGIFKVFNKNGIDILLDGTVWDGMFTGKLRSAETFRQNFELAIDNKKIKNAVLVLNIYKMDGGAKVSYELNTYIA